MMTSRENPEQIFMPVKGSKDYFYDPGFFIILENYIYVTEEM